MSGTLAVAGLTAPVNIVRDTWGVPHIFAASQDDLFFGQGLVQAQDRLFQMDLWRRSAQGRLSEVMGPNFIERDAMTRRMQYRGDPGAEWASYGPDAKAIADAFVRGVNAWVELARERPPEEFVLAGWRPELWTADDLLNRTEAFIDSDDALDEVFRARVIATVGVARARLLLPSDRTLDPPAGVDVTVVPDLVAEALRRVGTPPFFLGLAAPVINGTVRLKPDTTDPRSDRTVRLKPDTTDPRSDRTVRLKPDTTDPRPDRDRVPTLDNPSPRYFVHLHAPGWNVIGATAPWRPGVAEGHNERVAWTAEPVDADTQDVYVEMLNPSNPKQVKDRDGWVDIPVRRDWIGVRGRKTPVDFYLETTRHGVIVASDQERHLAFAMRWSGSEPGASAELAAPALDRASSWPEFRAALARWKMPARRMTYADADGLRREQVAALVPVRHGWSGAVPVPGWAATTEWAGWKTLDELPHAMNRKGTPTASGRAPASSPTRATQLLVEAMRDHPDRADALLRRLASAGSQRDPLTAQRGVIVDALAEALRDRAVAPGRDATFAHPLGITDAARRRFNVTVRAPDGVDRFAIVFNPTDWDRSTAMNTPGQSGSPDSPHFADLAKLWSAGQPFPLVFSEQAIASNASATLTLTPR